MNTEEQEYAAKGRRVHTLIQAAIKTAKAEGIDPGTFTVNTLSTLFSLTGICRECFPKVFDSTIKATPDIQFQPHCQGCGNSVAIENLTPIQPN